MSYNKRKRWLIIKNKYDVKANEYEISGAVAYLKLVKKDGTTVDAKIDAEDLQRVLDNGGWFPQWHKDFNSYLVQHYIDGGAKQTLHSFIMGEDVKAPIRHLNGDTLDNRKSNLEIYNRNSYNEYKELDGETVAVILRDNNGRESGKTIIDKDDLYRVINNGYPWVYYKMNEKPYAVANTPAGRIHLDKFIMGGDQSINIHHINLNTLDNRKVNLENEKAVEVEAE